MNDCLQLPFTNCMSVLAMSLRIKKKLATNYQLPSACEFQQFYEFNFLERKL